jgi:hypothetical protein
MGLGASTNRLAPDGRLSQKLHSRTSPAVILGWIM